MAPILTAEDVVRRIAAECAFVDERGVVVGIRLEAAAIVQFCARGAAKQARLPPTPLIRSGPLSQPNGSEGLRWITVRNSYDSTMPVKR
jgi:hypothetical protein